jgi:dienelactone hydrolase
MSYLWYWPAGKDSGWDFDAWKKKHDWTPITSEQSGKKEPLPLVHDGMTRQDWSKEAMKWRKVSEQVLGTLSDGPPTNFRYEALGVEYRTDKYTMRRYRYTLTDEEWGYAWLLLPHKRAAGDDHAVIALHQTAAHGKNEPCGLESVPEAVDNGVYYAAEMAERGLVVLAPDAIAFGERQSAHRNTKYHNADEFFTAQPHGSVMGKMGFDAARAVDFLEQFPQTKSKRIGCLGHSHGGYGTIFAMLADPRIGAGVVSCGMSHLRDDPGPERWWRRTALIPRLGFYEGDMSQTPIDFHQWLSLIAPRKVMVIAGTADTIFPNCAALPARLEMVKDVHKLLGAPDSIQWTVFDGPHRFPPESRDKAYEMLKAI